MEWGGEGGGGGRKSGRRKLEATQTLSPSRAMEICSAWRAGEKEGEGGDEEEEEEEEEEEGEEEEEEEKEVAVIVEEVAVEIVKEEEGERSWLANGRKERALRIHLVPCLFNNQSKTNININAREVIAFVLNPFISSFSSSSCLFFSLPFHKETLLFHLKIIYQIL